MGTELLSISLSFVFFALLSENCSSILSNFSIYSLPKILSSCCVCLKVCSVLCQLIPLFSHPVPFACLEFLYKQSRIGSLCNLDLNKIEHRVYLIYYNYDRFLHSVYFLYLLYYNLQFRCFQNRFRRFVYNAMNVNHGSF